MHKKRNDLKESFMFGVIQKMIGCEVQAISGFGKVFHNLFNNYIPLFLPSFKNTIN
jgi:hypothetical protein